MPDEVELDHLGMEPMNGPSPLDGHMPLPVPHSQDSNEDVEASSPRPAFDKFRDDDHHHHHPQSSSSTDGFHTPPPSYSDRGRPPAEGCEPPSAPRHPSPVPRSGGGETQREDNEERRSVAAASLQDHVKDERRLPDGTPTTVDQLASSPPPELIEPRASSSSPIRSSVFTTTSTSVPNGHDVDSVDRLQEAQGDGEIAPVKKEEEQDEMEEETLERKNVDYVDDENMTEAIKIQEYLKRSDTAVIFPEPVYGDGDVNNAKISWDEDGAGRKMLGDY